MADQESKRAKLTIVELKEQQPVGDKGAIKLSFKAKDEAGNQLWYFTFSKRLFETIEGSKDKEIDAEIVTSEREWDGNTYVDRKVTQIYIDGKPVGGGGGGGYARYQDSPEKIASIEAQKRADIIAQLWIADKIKDTDPLVKQLKGWLGNVPVEAKKEATKPPQKEEPVEGLFPEDPHNAKAAADAHRKATEQKPELFINIADLKGILHNINWTLRNATEFIKNHEEFRGLDTTGKLEDVLARMSKEQQGKFVEMVQELESMA